MRELRVEDALMYLDQVKMEFGDRPHIYNEFLDIMKTFKSQQIDTPGVIQRVSALFHGNKRLVLGFNTFLPEGYKIELPEGSGLAVYREPGRREAVQITWPGMAEHLALQQEEERKKKTEVTAEAASSMMPSASTPSASAASTVAAAQQQPPQQPPNTSATAPGQHIEFGHAINYVTTIKKRFASSPEIYRKFLEILHTYQKEQRGIKEVLDEVSTLFADHADLLKEFTYFLPDAVQGVAKAQLDVAAAKAEERMRLKQQNAKAANAGVLSKDHTIVPSAAKHPTTSTREERVPAAHVKRVPFGATKGRSENEETDIKKRVLHGIISFDPVRPPRRNEPTPAQAAHLFGRPTQIPPTPLTLTTPESELFSKIKSYLDNKDEMHPSKATRNSYSEFIKLLHLFGIGILSRDELLQMARGLLGKAPTTSEKGMKPHQLLNALDKLMNARGPRSRNKSQDLIANEHDSASATTPSYYRYSNDAIFSSNVGETELEKRVLNHKVCGKKGGKKMEEYDGVRWRKNVHEGVLVRVEDEMYEVDIAIERNAQTIKQLQPIADEMNKLKYAEEKAGQPIGRLQYKLKPNALNSIHIGAIARIYGDSGDEVIQHLVRNPLMVMPLIYQRLVEKDKEWREAKEELAKEWKEELKTHYAGSLDVKSYFYKVMLEKSLADETLFEECKGSYEPKQTDIQNIQFHNEANPVMSFYQPYLSLGLPNHVWHEDVYNLLSCVAPGDALDRVWNNFIAPWFRLSLKGAAAESASFYPGQTVKTTVDDGQILSVKESGDPSNTRYLVKFPFGAGYVCKNAILEVLPLDDASSSTVDVSSLQEDGVNSLFGTTSMYILLRLYICITTALSSMKESLIASDYDWLLKLAVHKDEEGEYETECKKAAGQSSAIQMFLNFPILVKKCANAIARVAEENVFVRLAHLSQLQLKDLKLLRALSLKATDEAVYRIHMKSDVIYFSYLPFDSELQLTDSPPSSMDVEATADGSEPDAKRQKMEIMVA